MCASRITDCLINEYTVWGCGPVEFRVSPFVICGGESRIGAGFSSITSLSMVGTILPFFVLNFHQSSTDSL